jgi:hypothetical protein
LGAGRALALGPRLSEPQRLRSDCRSTVDAVERPASPHLVPVGELLLWVPTNPEHPHFLAAAGAFRADDPRPQTVSDAPLTRMSAAIPFSTFRDGRWTRRTPGDPGAALLRYVPSRRPKRRDHYVLPTLLEATGTLHRGAVKLHLGILLGYLHSTLLKSFAFGLPSRSGSF